MTRTSKVAPLKYGREKFEVMDNMKYKISAMPHSQDMQILD